MLQLGQTRRCHEAIGFSYWVTVFKPSKNPRIEELTKSHRERRINLSDIDPVVIDDVKCCRWCVTPLKGRKYMWCSTECQTMAWAWANPQKEGGLHILLARQDFKCDICQFDYMPYVQDAIRYMNQNRKTIDPETIREKINERLMKILKYKAPSDRLPEVDHIVPIYKGGQSLGLDKVRCLCYLCHKAKTKVDNSGPRKKG
jgi:HNH endonuclease